MDKGADKDASWMKECGLEHEESNEWIHCIALHGGGSASQWQDYTTLGHGLGFPLDCNSPRPSGDSWLVTVPGRLRPSRAGVSCQELLASDSECWETPPQFLFLFSSEIWLFGQINGIS